jgi:hypothetical protein
MTVEFVLFLVLRPDSERVGPGLDAALIWLAVAVVAVGPLAVTRIAPRGVTARGRRWLRVARRWEGDHPPSADCALSRLEAGGARELLTDLDARLGVLGWSAEDLRSGHRDPHLVLPAACVRLREELTAAQIQRLVATLGEDEFVTLVCALGADRVAAALADAPAIVASASTWDLLHVVRRLGYPATRRALGQGVIGRRIMQLGTFDVHLLVKQVGLGPLSQGMPEPVVRRLQQSRHIDWDDADIS